MFTTVFNKIQASPTRILLASQEATSLSKLLLSSAGGGTTFLTPNGGGRNNIEAGGYIGSYINKAAGRNPRPARCDAAPRAGNPVRRVRLGCSVRRG